MHGRQVANFTVGHVAANWKPRKVARIKLFCSTCSLHLQYSNSIVSICSKNSCTTVPQQIEPTEFEHNYTQQTHRYTYNATTLHVLRRTILQTWWCGKDLWSSLQQKSTLGCIFSYKNVIKTGTYSQALAWGASAPPKLNVSPQTEFANFDISVKVHKMHYFKQNN